ncbi:MepB domain containing protein [Flavobacterium anhuiense]|uniref:MepB domain containing protein n=1 Tax=Flavobacterium anhuiense TaxID=459526 RepID=A0A444VVS6_9FLAO|nr:MepB family protein [Flavobacterium anhuiense]RYJ37749.1 MepB domain containing protein [Flavobacterium anhuiense]
MDFTIDSLDLLLSKKVIFDKAGLQMTTFQKESESEEYSAFRFQLNNNNICYREAKITPTKIGQFVTLWKRNQSGIIEPFDYSDTIDFVIVTVRKDQNWGQFIFPKKTLLEKGIFSTQNKEGIRATRVYPPWDETTSKQAQKTQKWQLNYFFNFSDQSKIDLVELKNIFA